jgi:hypothetical protein
MTKIGGSGSRPGSGSGSISQREAWICGSGSVPEWHGFATLIIAVEYKEYFYIACTVIIMI